MVDFIAAQVSTAKTWWTSPHDVVVNFDCRQLLLFLNHRVDCRQADVTVFAYVIYHQLPSASESFLRFHRDDDDYPEIIYLAVMLGSPQRMCHGPCRRRLKFGQ